MTNNRNIANLANILDEGSEGQVLSFGAEGSVSVSDPGGGGDSLGTVTGNDLDLSTGNLFEVTAADQTLAFSNAPDVHQFKVKLTGDGTVSGYLLSQGSYDSVSIPSPENAPNALAFNNDGTKLFIAGTGEDGVRELTLSSPFDVSTASYDGITFSAAAQELGIHGMAFNNDGTKMYFVGQSNDSVFQYSLSTAFDVSTASYDNVSLNVSSQDGAPSGLAFNNNGTKMYMVGVSSDSVHQYTLSTAFDVNTASYDNVSFSASGQDANPEDLFFNSDGTKMFIIGKTSMAVFQYSLSTAFDISTTSYDSISLDISAQETFPEGVTFSSDGGKMYIVGISDIVYQYTTSATTTATITYPNTVKFPGSTPPPVPEIGEEDILEFVTFDGGTSYNATLLGNNYS